MDKSKIESKWDDRFDLIETNMVALVRRLRQLFKNVKAEWNK